MFSIMRPSLIPSLLMRATLCGSLILPLAAGSAALGEATVRSSIGQRLDADIDIASLSSVEAESLAVRLAPADAFASAGIDYNALLRSLRFTIEKKADRHLVHVTSDLAVSDPFVNLLVELSANGTRTIRQYALLIDPPVIDQPSDAAKTPQITLAEPAATPSPAATIAANEATPADADRPSKSTTSRSTTSRPAQDMHVVRKGETLRSIASSLQPEGVQLEQVMVALQSANPSAFIERNANRLRSGSVLKVPETDAMRAVDAAGARRTLRAQTADFIRYQKLLAERSAGAAGAPADTQAEASSQAGNRSSGGGISVQMSESKTAPSAQDKLTLSSPGKGDATSSGANAKDALDKVAADKALADANSRIAALEKNIGQMQTLLEMQNKSLADAQQRAVQPAPKSEDKPDAKPEAKSDTKPVISNAETADTVTSPSVAETPSAASSAPAAAGPPAVAPARSQAPVMKTNKPDDSFAFLQDPVARAVAGGGAALVLLGWLLTRSRRGRTEQVSSPEAEPTIAQTVIGESGGRQIDTNHSVFHSNFVPSVSQIDANEVDAVAEADVYIAYGRDEQAEEILLDALRAHPLRHALRTKLLEIYATRKDKQKFGTLAAELRVLTHGQGPEWAQAAQFGQILDPGNHLYGAPSQTTIAAEPVSASPVADFELKLEGLLDEHRKERESKVPADPTDTCNTIDFKLSGIDAGAVTTAPAATGVGSEIGAAALNTKYELAIACREIGDNEGARELLSEVANARDPELAQRAKALLQQLA